MIRWSYLAPRLVLAGLLWAFCALAMDPLLERGIERSGSRSLGALVELSGVRTRLFPPSIAFESFAAADPAEPMKNLLEFRRLRISLEGRPLLEKKLSGSAELSGLRWGSPRSRSGALPTTRAPRAADALSAQAPRAQDIGLAAPPETKAAAPAKPSVRPQELKSLAMAKELKAAWPGRMKAWKERVDALDPEGKARELKGLIEKASASQDLPSRLASLRELQRKTASLKGELSELKGSLEGEADKARAQLRAVEAAKAADVEALKTRLNLPRFDAETLSSYLLGAKAGQALGKALRLLELAREHMPAKGEAPPPSIRGVDIPFPKERSWPAFHLKTVKLSGSVDVGEKLDFSGEARDLTTEPALLGRPAVVELRGSAEGRSLDLKAVLNHADPAPSDRLLIRGSGFPVGELRAGDAASVAVVVSPGTASFSGELALEGRRLAGKLSFQETGMRIEPQAVSAGKTVESALRASLAGLKTLSALVELSGDLDAPKLSVSSNLGEALSKALQQALGQELRERAKALEEQVERLVGEETRRLSRSLDEGSKDALSRLGLGDSKLKELQDSIAQKLRVPGPGLPDLKKLFR